MQAPLHNLDYAVVSLYLLAMIGIGWAMASRIKQFKDYFLAGGMLTTPLLVCTLVSTYYELDVTFATSESAYDYGLVAWVWLSRPYYVAIILAALLLTHRLRRHNFTTLPDLLEHHYGMKTRVVGAVACFIYSLPITAIGGMTVLFSILGWDPMLGLAVSIGICAAYTVIGGLWADAMTDTFQFVLMCVSLAIAIPPAVEWVGGYSFVQGLPEEHLRPTGGLNPWLIAAWTVGALTVFVEPAFYQRIFAAKDSRSVIRALLIGVLLWAAYDWGVTLIGMVARSAVDQGLLPEDTQGKAALVQVCMQTLPIGLRGLFLGGILAAAMSSVDSYGLLASGNLVYDIFRPLYRRPLSDRMLIRMTRIGVFLVMLLAAGLSLAFERITDAWVFLSGVLVSVVFVPAMAALFFRPARSAGLWGCAAGLLAYSGYYFGVYWKGTYDEEAESYAWIVGSFPLWREYAALFALPLSTLAFILGHMLARRTP